MQNFLDLMCIPVSHHIVSCFRRESRNRFDKDGLAGLLHIIQNALKNSDRLLECSYSSLFCGAADVGRRPHYDT